MERRCAILGDIHANLEALEAVLGDARGQGVTDFFCLGDVVGYNANPHECIAKIRELCAPTVRGNHDHYCSYGESLDDFQPNAARVITWTREVLNEDDKAWLAALPLSYMPETARLPGVTLVHGTLDMPERWGYVFDLLDADAHFSCQETPICFHGHTHVPVIFEKQGANIIRVDPPRQSGEITKLGFGRKYFINVGSVGQPRDGNPRASYAIYEPKTRTLQFRRIPYDIETAADKIRKAGMPDRLADRLLYGR